MKIDEAIEALKKFKQLGGQEVLIARDFAPGGDFTFKLIPTPKTLTPIVWINEVEDDVTRATQKLVEDMHTINNVLRKAGFEYPLGLRGVKDLADKFKYLVEESDRQLKVVLKKDLIGLDANGRMCEACNSFMHGHEWVIMDKDGFVEFCEHSIALTVNAQ